MGPRSISQLNLLGVVSEYPKTRILKVVDVDVESVGNSKHRKRFLELIIILYTIGTSHALDCIAEISTQIVRGRELKALVTQTPMTKPKTFSEARSRKVKTQSKKMNRSSKPIQHPKLETAPPKPAHPSDEIMSQLEQVFEPWDNRNL